MAARLVLLKLRNFTKTVHLTNALQNILVTFHDDECEAQSQLRQLCDPLDPGVEVDLRHQYLVLHPVKIVLANALLDLRLAFQYALIDLLVVLNNVTHVIDLNEKEVGEDAEEEDEFEARAIEF